MHRLSGDWNVAGLQKHIMDVRAEVEELSGQSYGLHHIGSVLLTGDENCLDWLRMMAACNP